MLVGVRTAGSFEKALDSIHLFPMLMRMNRQEGTELRSTANLRLNGMEWT
jgi:hypothetical protein